MGMSMSMGMSIGITMLIMHKPMMSMNTALTNIMCITRTSSMGIISINGTSTAAITNTKVSTRRDTNGDEVKLDSIECTMYFQLF